MIQTCGELLRIVQWREQLGRYPETLADFQTEKQASADGADRSGETGAALELRSGDGLRKRKRQPQPGHAGGGPQAGGLSAGGRPPRRTVSGREETATGENRRLKTLSKNA